MNENQKKAYDILATKMDARDHFFFKLKKFYAKNEYIPTEYKADWDAFRRDGYRPWRTNPKVMRRVVKAAKKAAKAKGLEELTAISRKELGIK